MNDYSKIVTIIRITIVLADKDIASFLQRFAYKGCDMKQIFIERF